MNWTTARLHWAAGYKIAIFSALLLAGAGLLGFSMRRTLSVHGNLSRQEVAEIVRAVRRDMWNEAFPDSSWRTVKRSPRALWAVANARVSDVTEMVGKRARVSGRFRLDTTANGNAHVGWDSWILTKDTAKWTVRSRGLTVQRFPRPEATPDVGASFAEIISNKSRLSYDAKP